MSCNNVSEATAGRRPQRQAATAFKEKVLPQAKQDLKDSELSQRSNVPTGTNSLAEVAYFFMGLTA